MTFRRFLRTIGYLLGRKPRSRLRFVRTLAAPPRRTTGKAMHQPVQVFDTISASDPPKFGENSAPAAGPSIGGSYNAGSRFAPKPADPLRRTRRR